ncbi:hypothetical protein BH10PLA1_BH10PLA1_07840 [soil metagenome]
MLKGLGRIISLCFLITIGSVGLYIYRDHFSAQHVIDKLTEEKKVLETVVQRLGSENRVAEVIVTDQHPVNGVIQTTLLFVEYAKDGRELPPKVLTVKGKTAHVDALVIKFDRDFVKENDPLRGKSIALFYRVFGDQESPADGPKIDEPGHIPTVYQGADPRVSEYEKKLWADFWKLAEDENYRKQYGVRVAQGEGPWGPFEMDRLYTLSIDADGGLNIRSEPLKGIYREALQHKAGLPTQPVGSNAPTQNNSPT